MKKFICLLFCSLLLAASVPALAQPDDYGRPYPGQEPRPVEKNPEHRSGWFLGSDQGVLFFVGDSDNFMGPQYYFTFFGGYNFNGWIAPMLRMGQAIGNANGFFDPTTFFFILEGGVKITPLRTKFRPYFEGLLGFYVLDYDDFGFPIRDDVNFTFSTGGGVEYKFGANTIGVGAAYRGMLNEGLDMQGVQVTFVYSFQF